MRPVHNETDENLQSFDPRPNGDRYPLVFRVVPSSIIVAIGVTLVLLLNYEEKVSEGNTKALKAHLNTNAAELKKVEAFAELRDEQAKR